MRRSLFIAVHLHDGRFHGSDEWPPSPARLFQALIAGAGLGGPKEVYMYKDALEWLENLTPPPIIAAPYRRPGQRFTNFVPNNDLDAKGGVVSGIAEIRTGKIIQPKLFDSDVPFAYLWTFDDKGKEEHQANEICNLANLLYQFGCGVDMAWATADLIEWTDAQALLAHFPGTIYRPAGRGIGLTLQCPRLGSLASVLFSYDASQTRFTRTSEDKKTRVYFSQPPKPRFWPVIYNAPNRWRLYELRTNSERSPFRSWPQDRVVQLVEQVRDAVVRRLSEAMPDDHKLIERVMVGRNSTEADKAARVRLIPIPSIGHAMTDRSVRRLLVEVPPDCPLRFEDLSWAHSGLAIDPGVDEDTGELSETLLTPAESLGMLRHYGIESGAPSRFWRTVTPAALPKQVARRRIRSQQSHERAKSGSERAHEEQRARSAVFRALRHAGIAADVEDISVQREPFSGRGVRAETFAPGTRFAKERLWHVALTFAEPVEGPLLIGDGRYLGLGLMAPTRQVVGIHSFEIVNRLAPACDPESLAKALRRAVMARVQAHLGASRELPSFFTGHERDGRSLRRGQHEHLAFAADLARYRLLIVAPHILEGRHPTSHEQNHLATLDLALRGFRELRAGKAGILTLSQNPNPGDDDPVFGRSCCWETVTLYRPARHARHLSPADALLSDVHEEIRRRKWPTPQVKIISVAEGPKGGLTGHIRLEFPSQQTGPILIGRASHHGGGLFQKASC